MTNEEREERERTAREHMCDVQEHYAVKEPRIERLIRHIAHLTVRIAELEAMFAMRRKARQEGDAE